jgi:Tfp pilus assembly protein PilV
MQFKKTTIRKGLTMTEVVVSATLVISMIGLAAPLTIKTMQTSRSADLHQMANQELANQMDRLTSLSLDECEAKLKAIEPSDTFKDRVPEAKLQGIVVRDQDGDRVVLDLQWQSPHALPTRLVGWIGGGL